MHDHAHHRAAAEIAGAASAFAVSASVRLGLALVSAAVLWLAVAWALGWL